MADSGIRDEGGTTVSVSYAYRKQLKGSNALQTLAHDVLHALSAKQHQRDYARNAVLAAQFRYKASCEEGGQLPGLCRPSLDVTGFTNLIRFLPLRLIKKLNNGISPEVRTILSQHALTPFWCVIHEVIGKADDPELGRHYFSGKSGPQCQRAHTHLKLEIFTHFYPQTVITAIPRHESLLELSENPLDGPNFERSDQYSAVVIAALDTVKPVLQNYLYVGVIKSNKRKNERKTNLTSTVKLYVGHVVADAWLQLWVCSSIGMQISEANSIPDLGDLRDMLGDYLWEGMESSQLRNEEKDKEASLGTRALRVEPEGDDCKISIALRFEVGRELFYTLFPKLG